MKLFFMILGLGIITNVSFGQGMLDQAKGYATKAQSSVSSMDPGTVTKVADQIMAKIGPVLKLTDAQKTSVNNAITGYLKNKQTIAPTAVSDKPAYTKQSVAAKSDLMSKMKSYLTKEQLQKFLKMKPKAGDKTNPLSAIF